MANPEIVVYGTYWCPDCKRAKKFLGEQRIPYTWIDIEKDDAAREYVEQINHGKRIIPTIRFADGSILVEPTNAELAAQLKIETKATRPYYDLIIVGAGVTGLTAALYAAREGMETLIVEKSGIGGQAGLTEKVENYPGFPDGIRGSELVDRIWRQVLRYHVEILQAQNVTEIGMNLPFRHVHVGDGEMYSANAILVATGADYRRLNVRGEDEYIGAGIHFCATCDGPFYKGADELVVVGGGNSAVEEGLFLTKFAKKVTLLVRGSQLSANKIAVDKALTTPQMDVRFNTTIQEFRGNGKLHTIVVKDSQTNAVAELHPAGAFIFIGQTPNTQIFKDYLELDEYGYIRTGHDLLHVRDLESYSPEWSKRHPYDMETCRPGIFAAGDVRSGATNQIAAATGEGASAAISIRAYMKEM
ncbi:MAG: FAD-dependent oxidoreductase [Chloroflexi bacterium]|nr:FAD-dependent oxidoreductase [Chloroflexota bacterium]